MASTVFVTGADRGLGFALCAKMLERGWQVIAGQYLPDWPDLSTLAGQHPQTLHVVPLDVSSVESTYTLESAYGVPQQGTPGLMGGGTPIVMEGTWAIVKGAKIDPDADVYQLHLENGQQPVSFLKADENHLFLPDRDGNLLVGNALFSYTLSRTDKDMK